jgi:hypothetical protein
MPEEVKSINITGNAAADMTGGKRTRRTTKKKQDGGNIQQINGVPASMNNVKGVESTASAATNSASTNSASWLKYPSNAPVPPKVIPDPSYVASGNKVAAPTQQYQGGAKKSEGGGREGGREGGGHIKVELKKKEGGKKVFLNPKKTDASPKNSKKTQTHKNKKVTLGISSLHKRITRAKKLHKKLKVIPLNVLRDKLIKEGLIKSTSKAPESVLRQIAEDTELVKNKAL